MPLNPTVHENEKNLNHHNNKINRGGVKYRKVNYKYKSKLTKSNIQT
jgi:hypothetical protein